MNVEWELGKEQLLADLCLEPKLTFSLALRRLLP